MAALSWLVTLVQCGRVLVTAPVSTRSHQNIFVPIIKALAERNHHVTLITNYLVKDLQHHPNVDQIEIQQLQLGSQLDSVFNMTITKETAGIYDGIYNLIMAVSSVKWTRDWAVNMTQYTYSNPKVLQLLDNASFDLVLSSQVLAYPNLPLAWHFQAPLAMFSVNSISPGFISALGEDDHPEYLPHSNTEYNNDMNLAERIFNTLIVSAYTWVYSRIPYYPEIQSTIDQVFPGSPPMKEIEKQVSVVFTNTNPIFHHSRAATPDTIEIGGINCRPPRPLPTKLEQFVTNHPAGFIIFGVGSAIPMNKMPVDILDAIIEAFARLPQRVVWQWKSTPRDDLPANIMAVDWLPQQDLLGHPNCRLFLTHGGLNSLMEAVYHGVPVLGLPISNDQYANLARAQRKGYALKFRWTDITQQSLFTTIQELINNPKYSETADKLSNLMRDQPQSPLDRAIYWTEYVMRHNGTEHLHLGSRHLAPYQRAMIDVYAVIAAAILLPIVLLAFIIRKCCCSKDLKPRDDKKKR